jgi:XTP/dITP diphosphohydrolase
LKLVFATHNKNKFIEVKAMLPSYIELLNLDNIDCREDIPETAETIAENAMLKAEYVRLHYRHDCFADDTGLEVYSLNNEPGVYSARYAGVEANSQANMKKLLAKLNGNTDRSARFKTVIALTLKDRQVLFEGICEGRITEVPRDEGGFGYDPIFQPDGYDKTFAEMPLSLKSEIGHRGKAMRQLIAYLKK